MASSKQTRGACSFCGKEMTRGGLTKHFKKCKTRQEKNEAVASGRKEKIFHLLVYSPYSSDMWLHLEMSEKQPLEALDLYLRAIWLECCGHLSSFRVNGVSYEPAMTLASADGYYEVASMETSLKELFKVGMQIPYEYDFGSTTALYIAVLDERKGTPLTAKPVFLMGRNQLPEYSCQACDEPALNICMYCPWETGDSGLLCKKHAKNHMHDEDDGLLPIVNSPRMGECAYSGPADPPY